MFSVLFVCLVGDVDVVVLFKVFGVLFVLNAVFVCVCFNCVDDMLFSVSCCCFMLDA